MVLAAVLIPVIAILGLSLAWNVAARRRLERELAAARASARFEESTMLRNRRAFDEDLEREVLRSDRSGSPVTLVLVGADAEESDDELEEVHRRYLVEAITRAVRAVDVSYRVGYDQFALILPHTRARGGLRAAARVVEAARACPGWTRASAGVAEGGPAIGAERLFQNGYCALLAAGRCRGSSVVVYSPELERAAESGELGAPPAIGARDEPSA